MALSIKPPRPIGAVRAILKYPRSALTPPAAVLYRCRVRARRHRMRIRPLLSRSPPRFSRLPSPAPACADVLIRVDKSAQIMTVTVDGTAALRLEGVDRHGRLRHAGGRVQGLPHGHATTSRASGTTRRCPTRSSSPRKATPSTAAPDVKHLGRPASHGCVRLAKANAAVLFDLVKEQRPEEYPRAAGRRIPDSYVASGREPPADLSGRHRQARCCANGRAIATAGAKFMTDDEIFTTASRSSALPAA